MLICTTVVAACAGDSVDDAEVDVPATGRTVSGAAAPTTSPPTTSGEDGPLQLGFLPFGLRECGDDPWRSTEADPSYYRDQPVYVANEQPIDEVRAWAATQPGFEDIWVDRDHNGWITVGFSENAAERQRDLETEFPGAGVVAVAVEFGESELESLRADVVEAIEDTPLGFGVGVSVSSGQVVLDLGVLDERTLEPLAGFAGRPLCLNGVDPANSVPNAPQPVGGDGWRLLGSERTGLGYRTGVATTQAQYEQVWRLAGIDTKPPPVDFVNEIVIWFGSVYGGGCEHRLDDVVIDHEQALVHGWFAVPGPPPVCNADANPEAYVVAVERVRLPEGPFAVQLGSGDPSRGSPEERTVVHIDLSEAGAAATEDQIGFDPTLVDEPWRIDLIHRNGVVEPGLPFTYALRTDCSLHAVGPINHIVWAVVDSETVDTVLPDSVAIGLPDAWTGGGSPYDPVVVEGLLDPDGPSLTFLGHGHTELFVPAPSGTHSDCH